MKNRRSMYVPPLDMYGPVHKGLRWALSRSLNRIGATSADDDVAVAAALEELEEVVVLAESHIAHEERFIHPAIEARRPRATENIVDEHADHANLLAGLRVLVSAIRSGAKPTRPALLRALYLRFADFVAENIHHMAEEEEVMQPLLEELYTTAELQKIHDDLLASIPPQEMIASLRIMLPANDFAFRLATLTAAKAAMPAAAFAGMFAASTVNLTQAEIEELADRLVPAAA